MDFIHFHEHRIEKQKKSKKQVVTFRLAPTDGFSYAPIAPTGTWEFRAREDVALIDNFAQLRKASQ